jgi:hypothetical protein
VSPRGDSVADVEDPALDERVGYGRPPLATRFRLGQSGNLRGRPKGARNFSTVIASALSERVAVTGTAVAGASPSSRRRSSSW